MSFVLHCPSKKTPRVDKIDPHLESPPRWCPFALGASSRVWCCQMSNSCHIEIDWGFSFNVHFNILQPTRGFYSKPLYMSWQTPWFSADSPINPICRSRKWQRSEQTEEIPVESADAIFDVSHDQKVMVPKSMATWRNQRYWTLLNMIKWCSMICRYVLLFDFNRKEHVFFAGHFVDSPQL